MNELNSLAEAAGATPSSFPSFDPSASIPLSTDISGRRGYDRYLSDAAIELYELLRLNEDLRASVGKDVLFHNKKIGKVPNFKKPLTKERRKALETLLHSLAHVASAPTIIKEGKLQRQACVAVPLDSAAFSKGKEYEALSATAIRDVVVALAKYDWIDVVPSHYNSETGVRRRTRVRPKRVMFDWMVKQGLVFPYHPRGPKHTKLQQDDTLLFVSKGQGQEGVKVRVPLTRALSSDEEVLVDLNDALHEQRLSCPMRDYRQYEQFYDYDGGRPRHTLKGRKAVKRVFSGKDGRAGRLYGHWVQTLPKELRGQLKINNKPTVELDYNGMQMALLYADAGKPLPDQGDLYAIPGCDRDDMKAVLLRTVGTATREHAVAALRKMLHEQGRSRPGRAEDLYDAFWGFHADVCPHGTSDSEATWARLQELDSTLALRVLRKLLDKGVVAIPIHDSFIVEERHADATEAVMLQEFEALFGVTGVSVKRG